MRASAGPGSTPSSSTRQARARLPAASASACRSLRYSASISRIHQPSRSGSAAIRASSSATSSRCRPRSRSTSIRASRIDACIIGQAPPLAVRPAGGPPVLEGFAAPVRQGVLEPAPRRRPGRPRRGRRGPPTQPLRRRPRRPTPGSPPARTRPPAGPRTVPASPAAAPAPGCSAAGPRAPAATGGPSAAAAPTRHPRRACPPAPPGPDRRATCRGQRVPSRRAPPPPPAGPRARLPGVRGPAGTRAQTRSPTPVRHRKLAPSLPVPAATTEPQQPDPNLQPTTSQLD